MKPKRLYAMLAATLVCVGVTFAQQEMSKEQWQQEVNRSTQLRNELQTKVQHLTNEVNALQAQSSKLDGDVNKCMGDLYTLVGADVQKTEAYRAEIEAAERKADDLIRLSDADLSARSGEVNELAAEVKSLPENKLSLIPEFSGRLDALDHKAASLQKSSSPPVATANSYTVGNGDCLWNISKKKDIYSNAWLWPKIWKGNDLVKNPDVIRPGQKLTIPPGGEMSSEEKAAAKKYYAKKLKGAL